MLELLWLPFLACLVLTGIHVYLGLHVLARGVIFVDLALAQVAALGIALAFLAGHPIRSEAAYWYALAFTPGEVGALALLYSALGVLHWAIRRPLLEISFGVEAAAGRAVRWWDFV